MIINNENDLQAAKDYINNSNAAAVLKAHELVNKYYNKIEHTISNQYESITKEITKECALIAVDEILKITLHESPSTWVFYMNVEKEIEKL